MSVRTAPCPSAVCSIAQLTLTKYEPYYHGFVSSESWVYTEALVQFFPPPSYRLGSVAVLLEVPDLELVVGVVRVVRTHEVELGTLALLARLNALLEALAVFGHETCRLVHDSSDVRRGVDDTFHLTHTIKINVKTHTHTREFRKVQRQILRALAVPTPVRDCKNLKASTGGGDGANELS